jgi:F-type H+-transporting ATPase subunit gamma
MEMVATSKLKKATDRVYAARPYGQALEAIVQSLFDRDLAEKFSLLRTPMETKRVAVLLLTANRGLAGAFNVNLIRKARDLMTRLRREGVETELHISGKKGVAFFRFQGEPIAQSWIDVGDSPTPEGAGQLIDGLRERFETGALDGVWIVGSEFRSALSTPPMAKQLLPITPGEGGSSPDSYILSPSGDEILGRLLPLYLRNTVYRALVENSAAEQGARRSAMKSATDNAKEMLETLLRQYNRARQAQITQEIAEIVGGAAAFE